MDGLIDEWKGNLMDGWKNRWIKLVFKKKKKDFSCLNVINII